jgi:hypothetical protein
VKEVNNHDLVEDLKYRLIEAESEKESAKTLLQSKHADEQSLRLRSSELEKEVEAMAASLAKSNSAAVRLQQRVSMLEAELAESQRERDAPRRSSEAESVLLTASNSRLATELSEIEECKARYQQMEAEVAVRMDAVIHREWEANDLLNFAVERERDARAKLVEAQSIVADANKEGLLIRQQAEEEARRLHERMEKAIKSDSMEAYEKAQALLAEATNEGLKIKKEAAEEAARKQSGEQQSLIKEYEDVIQKLGVERHQHDESVAKQLDAVLTSNMALQRTLEEERTARSRAEDASRHAQAELQQALLKSEDLQKRMDDAMTRMEEAMKCRLFEAHEKQRELDTVQSQLDALLVQRQEESFQREDAAKLEAERIREEAAAAAREMTDRMQEAMKCDKLRMSLSTDVRVTGTVQTSQNLMSPRLKTTEVHAVRYAPPPAESLTQTNTQTNTHKPLALPSGTSQSRVTSPVSFRVDDRDDEQRFPSASSANSDSDYFEAHTNHHRLRSASSANTDYFEAYGISAQISADTEYFEANGISDDTDYFEAHGGHTGQGQRRKAAATREKERERERREREREEREKQVVSDDVPVLSMRSLFYNQDLAFISEGCILNVNTGIDVAFSTSIPVGTSMTNQPSAELQELTKKFRAQRSAAPSSQVPGSTCSPTP